MKKQAYFITALLLLFTLLSAAQVKIGDNPAVVGASSALELESTNKALLMTRVATTASIVSPLNGMLIYDISSNCVKGYQNGAWTECLGLDSSTLVLMQIGNEGDSPNSVTSVVTVEQINTISPAITGAIIGNQTAYQAYIDANPNLFAAPATAAEVQAMVTAVNSAAVLAQIGNEGDSPNTITSVVTVEQINTIFPAITGAIIDNQTAYQAYIDFNPNLFASPATVSEVQAMVNAVNAAATSGGTAVVSAYDCSTASAGTLIVGSAVSGVSQTITATVNTAGTYSISATANGVTFAGSGTFAGTGAQDIVLTATGTPTAAGSHSFTLNTTTNCSFSRTTLAPLPANITLSAIGPYFVASVNDQDYLPYTAPTVAASLATAQAANGVNEATPLNIQGSLTTTGVTLKIPYTVSSGTVNLPAFTQTINVPSSFTEDGITRDVTFSYAAASLGVGTGTINVTLQAVGGTLNAKKLDIQTGIGNDNLGWLLAQFTYATNNSGGSANFDFRNIAAIPDRNISDAAHVMFYMPVLGAEGKTWLNNNLGANYANTTSGAFNPATQAGSSTDANAYGSLFQWGRYSDGHEFRSSGNTQGPIATPWTSINFITTNTIPRDWRDPQNDNLWQGVSGTNNPCPIGYRVPTDTELNNQRLTWSANSSTGAFASPLKLPRAGYRNSGGAVRNVAADGHYWCSTVSSTDASYLSFVSINALVNSGYRDHGRSVRCLKD